MTVSITIDDITLTYTGPYTVAGLYDLVNLARSVLSGSDYDAHGFSTEAWIFGDHDEVLADHYSLKPGYVLRFDENGHHELVPDSESPTEPTEEW